MSVLGCRLPEVKHRRPQGVMRSGLRKAAPSQVAFKAFKAKTHQMNVSL